MPIPERALRLAPASGALILVGLSTAGCASNVLTSDPSDYCSISPVPKTCDGGVPTGLAYSLPKGRILLAANRKQIQPADVSLAQLAVAQAGALVAKDTANLTSLQGNLAHDQQSGASQVTLTTDVAAVAQAQVQLGTDTLAYKAASSQLNILNANVGNYTESVTITQLGVAPDPSERFVANLDHRITRDDTLNLHVVNGLLSSGNATSTDETPNLLVSLADTAITVATLGAAPPPGKFNPNGSNTPPPSCAYDISIVFDPLDTNDRGQVEAALEGNGAGFYLSYMPDPVPTRANVAPRTEVHGLVYRLATAVVVTTVDRSDPGLAKRCPPTPTPLPSQSLLAVVPDTRTDFIVPSLAGPFTTTNLSFGFSNGMLTDFTNQRPSELAAVANIPVQVADALVSIPTQILQLRVSYDTAATAAVNGQAAIRAAEVAQKTAIVNAETGLKAAETQLMQAELAQPAASINGQAAIVNARAALDQAEQALEKAAASTGGH